MKKKYFYSHFFGNNGVDLRGQTVSKKVGKAYINSCQSYVK